MPEHMHHGEAHAVGTRPADCVAAGFGGPVIRCDRGGWLDPARPLFCTHADAPAPTGLGATPGWSPYIDGGAGGAGGGHTALSGAGGGGAGGGVLGIPSGTPLTGYGGGGGHFSSWTRPVSLSGSPGSTVIFARGSNPAIERQPVRVVDIPCNPDAPGEARVELREWRPALVEGAAPAGFAEAVLSELGFEAPGNHELVLDQVLRGERCRSVRYAIHVQAIEYTAVVHVGPAVSIHVTVTKPVGFVPVKTYVEPTCCAQTTQRLHRKVVSWFAAADGEARPALRRAGDELLAASVLLPQPATTSDAIECYARAARHLVDAAARVEGARAAADAVAGIVRGLAEGPCADALASPFAASSTLLHLALVRAGAAASADLAVGDAARGERPDEALVWYAAAYHTAAAAVFAAHAAPPARSRPGSSDDAASHAAGRSHP